MKTRTLYAISNYFMVGAPIVCVALITDQQYWIVAFLTVAALAAYYKEYLGAVRLEGGWL